MVASVTATSGGLSMTTRSNRSPSSCMILRKRSEWSSVGRVGGHRAGRDRPEVLDDRGLGDLFEAGFAEEHVRDAGVADAVEDAVEAGAAEVAVHHADAEAALCERDREAARDHRLPLGRSGARHEDAPDRVVGAHEHEVRADGAGGFGEAAAAGDCAR